MLLPEEGNGERKIRQQNSTRHDNSGRDSIVNTNCSCSIELVLLEIVIRKRGEWSSSRDVQLDCEYDIAIGSRPESHESTLLLLLLLAAYGREMRRYLSLVGDDMKRSEEVTFQ